MRLNYRVQRSITACSGCHACMRQLLCSKLANIDFRCMRQRTPDGTRQPRTFSARSLLDTPNKACRRPNFGKPLCCDKVSQARVFIARFRLKFKLVRSFDHTPCFPRPHDLTTRALYLQQSGCVATWLICMLQTSCRQPERKSSWMMQLTWNVEDCQTLRRRNKATNDEQQEELRERFAVEVAERVSLVTHLRSPDPHLESTSESRGGDHCAHVAAS